MTALHKIARVACLATLVTSCAGLERYEARPVDGRQTALLVQSRSERDEGLQAFMRANGHPVAQWPLTQWDLPSLTLAAFYYHPDLDVARAAWAEARAAEITARRREGIGVSIAPESHSRTDGGISPWTLGFAFDWRYVPADKREARREQAALQAEAARLEVGATAWRVRVRVKERLLACDAARREVDLAEREASAREEYATLLERRLAAGAIARPEATAARLAADDANLRLVQARNRHAASHAALAEAVGLPPQRFTVMKLSPVALDQSPAAGTLDSAELESAALTGRIDVRRALATYAAADQAYRLQVANQYPDIELRPGYAWDQGDHRWGLGVGISLPLPDTNRGPIAEARARRETEARRVLALQAQIVADLGQARARYAAAVDERRRVDALQAQRAQRLADVERRFQRGLVDRVEVASARVEALSGERAGLSALLAQQSALVALENALEVPLDDSRGLGMVERDPRSSLTLDPPAGPAT